MDFNSFCQIELYLDKRILDWRFYILGWAGGAGGAGEKVKGKRNKFNLSPFPLTPFPFPMPCLPNAQTQELKSDLKVYTTELLLKDS
ncbi:MAG: hypothetical protein RMY28_033460 [Nostoc sp. ChiSLP01]|nr:hypothetical protein [Nostoc sp. CmiSLP01]